MAKFINTRDAHEETKNSILKKVELLAELDHPNIVRVHEYYEEQNYIVIIMSHCSGGSLNDAIINKGDAIEE